jgi:glycosyltransferase involved in cell wall biosynthesis
MLWQQQRWSRLIGPDLVGYVQWIKSHVADFNVSIFKAYLYAMATRGIPATFGRTPILFNPEAHPESMLNLSLHESVFRLADAFQFHSREEAELVCRRFGFTPPHEVVGIGVDERQFHAGATDVLSRLGLTKNSYAVVVGRIDAGKGSFEAHSYFSRYVEKKQSDLKFVFVGEQGGLSDLGPQVVPTGFVTEDEKRDLIAGSLCLIQPSYLESFSIVLTEAWALGRPVLVQERSDVLRGQTARAGGGLCFRDYESFERALEKLHQDQSLGDDLGRSGQMFVKTEYSWPAVISRFEKSIDKAIESHRRRHAKQ